MDDQLANQLQQELEADYSDQLTSIDHQLINKSSTSLADDYERLGRIGQGTFGEVFKVKHKATGQVYALKRLKIEQETEGFPLTALREIRILSSLSHENIVTLRDVCHKRASPTSNYRYEFYLLFDLCEHDLSGLLAHKVEFPLNVKRDIMKQLFSGLHYLQERAILHRDLKTSNILINRAGQLKIADFGLARRTAVLQPPNKERRRFVPRYTGRVVTLWYRPPEILLGDRQYGYAVDLWGAGCIMAELWLRRPLLQGSTELSQLSLIVDLCGSITPEVWPKSKLLLSTQSSTPLSNVTLKSDVKRLLREQLTSRMLGNHHHLDNKSSSNGGNTSFQQQTLAAVDLIDQLLQLDPLRRPTASQALKHVFFTSSSQAPPSRYGGVNDLGAFVQALSSATARQPVSTVAAALPQQQAPPHLIHAPQRPPPHLIRPLVGSDRRVYPVGGPTNRRYLSTTNHGQTKAVVIIPPADDHANIKDRIY